MVNVEEGPGSKRDAIRWFLSTVFLRIFQWIFLGRYVQEFWDLNVSDGFDEW